MQFKVLVNGENFFAEMDGKPQLVGFYTMRVVNADDRKQAEEAAVEVVKDDLPIPTSEYCRISVAQIEPVQWVDTLTPVPTGFVFYLMDGESN
jgi:hypothetical protein